MADRLDSEKLRGFDFRRTDRLTNEQTFAIVESLLRLKTYNIVYFIVYSIIFSIVYSLVYASSWKVWAKGRGQNQHISFSSVSFLSQTKE